MFVEPTPEEINRIQSHLRIKTYVNEKSGRHAVADCVACGKKEHLYFNVENGCWDCKKCGESGTIWKLATQLNIRLREKRPPVHKAKSLVAAAVKAPQRIVNAKGVTPERVKEATERLWAEGDEEGAQVRGYLEGRGFTETAIRRFGLGVAYITERDGDAVTSELAVGIPYLNEGRVPLVKMRNLAKDKDARKFRRTKGSESLLFNADSIRECAQVVLCEAELDAVSLWQLGVTNVAATSLGAKKDLPEEWVGLLAHAEDLVLLYDEDEAGQEAVQMLVHRLGPHRCRIARIPDALARAVEERTGRAPKDANDLLVGGASEESVRGIIRGAQHIENTHISMPSSFNDALSELINQGESSLGTPVAYQNLNTLLRGWRPREITVVTGHSGHGKSTQFLDIAATHAHGEKDADGWVREPVPTLVVSLENGPLSVAQMLFQQRLGRPISSLRTDADKELAMAALDSSDNDPLYILTLEGEQPFDVIEDHVRYAAKRYGIKAFLFDHGHYVQHDPRVDFYQHMRMVGKRTKQMARDLGIHVWLVLHPKTGIEEMKVLSGEDILGGASLKQEADNGVSVWRLREGIPGSKATRTLSLRDPNGRKVEVPMAKNNCLVWVWKKRHHDAREGIALFDFDPRNLKYREIAPPGSTAADGTTAEQQPGVSTEDDPF